VAPTPVGTVVDSQQRRGPGVSLTINAVEVRWSWVTAPPIFIGLVFHGLAEEVQPESESTAMDGWSGLHGMIFTRRMSGA
jgi:hypothetical protein